MNFKEFEEAVLDKVKENVGEEADVLIHSVTKNNGLKLNGIVILKKDDHISPTIYLEQFYDDYMSGQDIDDIVDEIMQVYTEQKGQVEFDPEQFKNIGETRSQIMFKLVNYERNEELLKLVPHRRFLDLAIVYYVVVTANEFGIGSILIRNEHLEFWDIGEEDLFGLASVNTPQKMPYMVKSMANMILELLDKRFTGNNEYDEIMSGIIAEDGIHWIENNAIKMYVLTNRSKVNGANTILYKDVLKDIAETAGTDLYILPSSIHEVIIVPQLEEVDEEMLLRIVRDVNENNVLEEEWLSDSVYIYKYAEDRIEMIN